MVSIVKNYLQGFDDGTKRRLDEERRNALAQAGRAFNMGQYDQAEQILMPIDPEAGIRYGEYGATKRAERRVQDIGRARAQGGFQGVVDWGKQQGDFDAMTLAQQGLDAEKAAAAAREADNIGWMSRTLLTYRGSTAPPEQRHADFLARARARGIGDDVLSQVEVGDFTDDGLTREAGIGLSIADQINLGLKSWSTAGDGSIGYVDPQTGDWVSNTGERSKRAPRSASAGYSFLTPQQALELGLPPGAYQQSANGRVTRVGGQQGVRQLSPGDAIKARAAINSVPPLRQSLANFRNLLQNATPADLFGLGPNAAQLAAAHRLLAIQMKSPAALDLGALVGADFAILNDIVGEPGNFDQIARYGGKEGYLQRLVEVDNFLKASEAKLYETYAPYADTPELQDVYQGQSQGPFLAPGLQAPPAGLGPGRDGMPRRLPAQTRSQPSAASGPQVTAPGARRDPLGILE